MKNKKMLRYGYHNGTMMSRDYGDAFEVSSKKEAERKATELDEHYRESGYMLWFANYHDGEKESVPVHPGNSYT